MPAQVTVNVNVNENGATQTLTKIDSLVQKLNGQKIKITIDAPTQQLAQLQNIAKGFTGTTTAATAAATAITGYGQKIKESVTTVDGAVSRQTARFQKDAQTVVDVTRKVTKEGEQLTVKTTDNYEAIKKAGEKQWEAQQKLYAQQFAAFDKREKRLAQLQAEEEKAAKAEADAATKAAKAQQEAADKRLATYGRIIKVATAAFLIKETKEALSTMKDVDTELANIRKVTDASAESIANLGEQAYSTASKYGVSAKEYLSSAAEFAKAGYKNYADLSELAIKTQLVGDVSAETASKFLLSADAAYKFGGNIDSLSTVLDRANVIENNYATSIYKIAEGMPIVASTAAMANMSIDELMAGLGTITAVTQETGRKAATALRALILNIEGEIGTVIDEDMTITQESVESMADALKKYGNEAVKAAQKTGKLVDPMEAIKSLAEAYKRGDLSDQGLFDILSSLGGKLRTNQLTAIVKNFDMFSEMLDKIKDSAGSAEKELDVMLDTWNAKTNILKNTWTEFVSNIIKTDTVKGGIDALTNIISGLNDFISTSFGNAVMKWGAVVVAFSQGLNLIKTIIKSTFGQELLTSLGGVVTALTGGGGLLTALQTVGTTLLHSPVVWAAVAAAAVIAINTIHKTAEEKYQDAVENVNSLVEEYNKLYGENGVYGQELTNLVNNYDQLNEREKERLGLLQSQEEVMRKQVVLAKQEEFDAWQKAYGTGEGERRARYENGYYAGDDIISHAQIQLENLRRDLANVLNLADETTTQEEILSGVATVLEKYRPIYEQLKAYQDMGFKITDKNQLDFLHQMDIAYADFAETTAKNTARQEELAEATTKVNEATNKGAQSFNQLTTAVDKATSSGEELTGEAFKDIVRGIYTPEMQDYINSLLIAEGAGADLNEQQQQELDIYKLLGKELAELEEDGSNWQEVVDNLIAEYNDYVNGIADATKGNEGEAESLEEVATAADNATSALKRFQEATATTKSANAEGYRSAYQGFLTDWEAGKTDTNVVRAAMDMFVTPEMQKALGYNMQAIGEVMASDLYKGIYNGASGDAGVDFVNYIKDNMTDALDEIVNITTAEDGTLGFEYASMQKLAEYFQLPLGAIEALINSLDEFGVQAGIGWEDAENWAEAIGLIGENAGKSELSLQGVAQSIYDMGKTDPTEIRKIFDALSEGGFLEGLGDFSDAEIGEAIANVIEQAESQNPVEIEYEDNAPDAISRAGEVKAAAAEAQGTYDIIFNIQTVGSMPSFGSKVIPLPFAEGTKYAPGGMALVNELGPELISDNGKAYIANGGKPAIVNLGEGAVVLTAEETRQALGNATINNGINAYKGGLANTPAGNKATGSSGIPSSSSSQWQEYWEDPNKGKKDKDSSSSSKSDDDDPWKDKEDALKDALDELDELAEWYHNQKKHTEEGNTYAEAIKKIDALRKEYLNAGFAETSKEVTTLANKIFDYEKDIAEAKAHAIDDLEEELDILESQIELAENQGDLNRMLELQNDAQKKVAQLIEAYRAAGFSDTSPEILKLANMGFDYASDSGSTMKDLWKNLIDAIEDMRDTQDDANELAEKQLALDEAREALTNAQNQRTVRIFNPVTGQWEWVADAKSVKQAQENLTNAEQALLKEQQSQELNALKKAMENGGSLSDVSIGPGLSALLSGASLEQTDAFASALGLLSGGFASTADTSSKSIFDSVDSHDNVTQYTFNGVTIDAATAESTTLAQLTQMITPLALTNNMPA